MIGVESPMLETSSMRPAVSIQYRLVTDTYKHRAIASTALAQRRVVKNTTKSVVHSSPRSRIIGSGLSSYYRRPHPLI